MNDLIKAKAQVLSNLKHDLERLRNEMIGKIDYCIDELYDAVNIIEEANNEHAKKDSSTDCNCNR